MVRSAEELMNSIRTILGDNQTSDEGVALLEDVTDTLNSMQSQEQTDWKTKYEENDKSWRQRYTDRFFQGNEQKEQSPIEQPLPEANEPEEPQFKTYGDLFK